VNRQGNIARYADAKIDTSIIDFAHGKNVKAFVLVANLPDESGTSWDWRRVDPIMRDAQKRSAFISQVLKIVADTGADGLTLDFEYLRESQRAAYSTLVTQLAASLHRRGKLLRVAVSPRRTNRYTNGQDFVAIARAADFLTVMTYNEHWDESRPGPIASRTWVEQVLSFIRSLGVPMSKVSMGVPLYAYDWPERSDGSFETADGLEYQEVVAIRRQYEVTPVFHQPSQSPFMAYTKNGQRHIIWYENHQSLPVKMRTAVKFGVGSIALWRLGGEDPRIWTALAAWR
jgi:spore germination protein YaaH